MRDSFNQDFHNGKFGFLDDYSRIKSFLSCLDPRIKIIVLLSLVIFISITPVKAFLSYSAYAGLIMALIILSKIPVGIIFRRSLVIVPFVAVIAVFIPFASQSQGILDLRFSQQGFVLFGNILIKAYLSVVSLILLVFTTNFPDLLKAFEMLKFPRLFIMTISFMYRYIFVIHDEMARMLRAKESRAARLPVFLQVRVLSNMLGVLFIRSYERAESVYLAMRARGYNGNSRVIRKFGFARNDLLFLGTVTIFLAVVKITGG